MTEVIVIAFIRKIFSIIIWIFNVFSCIGSLLNLEYVVKMENLKHTVQDYFHHSVNYRYF